jgi:hypothetical protein
MRIKLKDYNSLDIHGKASLLPHAVVVDNMMKGGKGYSLYTYGSYYIEVLFDIKTSYLLEITAFANGPRLDKYLDKIKLRECI